MTGRPPQQGQLTRYWRAFFAGLLGCAFAGMVLVALAPDHAGLFLLGLYCIPANSVLPLPHEPGLLYFAQFHHPIWIALAATTGSAIACFADYAIVGAAMRNPTIGRARNSGLFQWAMRWVSRSPFLIIVLFTVAPLPISPIRILAPAAGYPIGRYLLAQIVGRFPRFLAFAYLGHLVHIPTWLLVAMFVSLLVPMWLGSRSEEEELGLEEVDDDELSLAEAPRPGGR